MSVVGYIAQDLSPENESGDGHRRNELAISKTFMFR